MAACGVAVCAPLSDGLPLRHPGGLVPGMDRGDFAIREVGA